MPVADEVTSLPKKTARWSNEERLRVYYFLKLTRECDNAILRLYKQGRIVGGAYTGYGNEATAVGSAFSLERQDYLLPMHRDLGAHLVRGQSLRNLFLQQLGRAESLTGGKDGTGHYADTALRIYGNVSHLAAMIPISVGFALASKIRKENAVVMNYIGDGGASVGEFHEGLNMAAVMQLPFVLIVENNQYAYSTPTARQFNCQKLSDRAMGYGIPGITIDGTDVTLVYENCRKAVDRARRGGGPTLIETVTMRMHGHSAADDASYVPKEMIDRWKKKDPIDRFEKILQHGNVLPDDKKREIEDRISREIEEAVTYALNAPLPAGEDALKGVFAS